MRTIAAVALATALGAGALPAQFERRYEVGLFGAMTKYDRAFGLDDKIGGGVRFAYALNSALSLELEALFQPPHTIAPSTDIEPLIGGASLVLNVLNADRMAAYVLGGYSRLDFGGTNPYRFTDGAAHGGAGVRFFLSDNVAFRVEARGIYTPETNGNFGQQNATHLLGSVGLAFFQADRAPPPAPEPPPAIPIVAAEPAPPPAAAPADSDGDGVVDGTDVCPDTPLGATVDPTGCPIDSDRDVVWDGLDRCPATPIGAVVDSTGCPTDADLDGVPDGIDRCPNTVAGTPVDAAGCPADEDRDGVPNSLDRCPNTPPGTEVDANGCGTARDTDRDGVGDPQDRCPGTPPGSRVDQFGCLILFEERAAAVPGDTSTPARPTLVLRGVNFQSGRSVLTTASYRVLEQVAASLIANPEIRIEIAGYTDSTGSAAMNLRLSNARAQAVRAYLARRGVNPSRMEATGYGASGYIAPNATPEGRALNRRVELHKIN